MDSYDRTLAWLYSLDKSKGIDLKLERVSAALAELGNPQRGLHCLHVAGTNGKGSVVAFVSAVLAAANNRVGMYTSPHLIDLTERIQVAGESIGRAELVALSDEIRRRVLDRGIGLTFFEVMTAMAFLHFARAGVDYAVLEVGLGGRLDATNVVDPLVTVITTIGIDHTEYLGTTVREIAAEKAGIAKPGVPLILGSVNDDAAAVIEGVAQAVGAPLYQAGRDFRCWVDAELRLGFEGFGWRIAGLEIGLAGRYQRDNAAVAIAALAALRGQGPIEEQALRDGMARAQWPGRLQTVMRQPRTIVDGAHNADAMRVLVDEVERIRGDAALHVLFTAMGDKGWPEMIQILAPQCASVVVTEVLPERVAPVELMRKAFAEHCPVLVQRDPVLALAQCRAGAHARDIVLVTGSLFLAGKVLEHLQAVSLPRG